jgi:hypothetical protein
MMEETLKTLMSVGAPGLAVMVLGLLWDRRQIKAELKGVREESKEMTDRLISLALTENGEELPCPELRRAQKQNEGSGKPRSR